MGNPGSPWVWTVSTPWSCPFNPQHKNKTTPLLLISRVLGHTLLWSKLTQTTQKLFQHAKDHPLVRLKYLPGTQEFAEPQTPVGLCPRLDILARLLVNWETCKLAILLQLAGSVHSPGTPTCVTGALIIILLLLFSLSTELFLETYSRFRIPL